MRIFLACAFGFVLFIIAVHAFPTDTQVARVVVAIIMGATSMRAGLDWHWSFRDK